MQLVRCLSRLHQLFLFFAALVFSVSAQARSLKIEFPVHHVAYHLTGNSVTVQAALEGYNYWDWYEIEYFDIHINGTTYEADIWETDWDIKGQYTLNVAGAPNPKQYDCYATVGITWSYYGYVFYDELYSRNTSSSNFPGNGYTVSFILSNMKVKSFRWMDTAADVDINRQAVLQSDGTYSRVIRPDAAHPYHWQASTTGPEMEAYPAVYVKGDVPKLKVDLYPLTGTVPVRTRAEISITSEGTNYQPFSTTAGITNSSATITGPALLNKVDILFPQTKLDFDCQFTDGYWSGIYGMPSTFNNFVIYKVYAAPITPMSPPWEGVLWYSCFWASGKSTAADVGKFLTIGLYFSNQFIYDPTMKHYTTNAAPNTFLLTSFLNQHTDPNGDCVAVSDFLCICARAQGLAFTVGRYNSSPNNDFSTNLGCPIGSDPSAHPVGGWDMGTWTTYPFVFHQPAFAANGTVFDAAIAQKYDLSGAIFRNPPFDWNLNGYWQTPAPPGVSTPLGQIGLVAFAIGSNNTPLANPATPHQLDSYVPDVF
jgi:hypothetical protein